MNSKFFFLIAVLYATTLFSQNRSKFYHKIMRKDIKSGYINLIFKKTDGTIEIDSVCSKFLKGVITLDKGIPVVDFWTIKSSKSQREDCISNETKIGSTGRFEIDLKQRNKIGDPTLYVVVPFRAWTYGVGTTPFRYRPKNNQGPSTVSSNLGVSFNFGRTFGWSTISPRAINNFSVTVGPFIGLSSVDLKKSTVKNPGKWITDRTNAAFSYGLNSIIARNNFGVVFSLGFDSNFGIDSKEWGYQNKPWIGVGISTSLGSF